MHSPSWPSGRRELHRWRWMWADVNRDGFDDLFVSEMRSRSRLRRWSNTAFLKRILPGWVGVGILNSDMRGSR